MAFKMKGSAFKLGNVATKSVLKQTSPMKRHEPGHEPERDPNGPPPPTGGHDPNKPIRTDAEGNPIQMKSPLEDKGNASSWYDPDNKDHVSYAKKHDALHSKNDPMNPAHGEPKTPAKMKSPLEQDIRGSWFERNVMPDFITGRDTGKLYEGKTYTDAVDKIKSLLPKYVPSDKGRKEKMEVEETIPTQMKSPLEQTVTVTPADKKEYDEKVGKYVRQSANIQGSKKAQRMKKRRLKKEAKAAKGPKKGINIDFRKTRSNKKGTGGRIGIRLIPKITRKGRGITFN